MEKTNSLKPSDKNAREETLNSHEWMKSIVDKAPIFICRYLADTTITFVNETMCTFLKLPKDKIIGEKWIDWVPDSEKPVVDKMINSMRTELKSVWIEHGMLNSDGMLRITEWNNSPMMTEKGDAPEYQGFGRDITEKKEIEDALRSERELFIWGPVTVFKWVATPEAPTVYVSPNVKTTLGYDVEEFLSGAVNFKLLIHPDDRQRISNEVKANISAGSFNYEQQYRIKNKNGIYRWYTDFTRVITNSQGEITHYHGYLFDNTAQKNAEEALRLEHELFNGGPVVTVRWIPDASGCVKYISPNVSGVLGYKPKELIRKEFNYNDIIHPDDLSRIQQEIVQYRNTFKDQYEQEYRIKRRDNEYIWVHDFTKASRNEENEIIDLHGYLVDITSRKKTEEVLLKSEQELRKTNLMKDKFFSIISHDLRSPFQGLLGMANILVEDEELTDEEKKEFTVKLYEGLKAQFHFIDDLLTWNRIQRGAIEFNPTVNDIISIVEETISLLKNSIENKNLKLIRKLPQTVLANFDRNMVATIVRNLISNAVKFSFNGGNLIISVSDLCDKIEVAVQDTGIGINEINLKKLWDADAHFTTKGTEGEGGTGLGLILCKDFVEKHGGVITVQSQVEKGSTFCFTIPKK